LMNRRHTSVMLFCVCRERPPLPARIINVIAACLLAFAFQQAAAAGPASAPITLTLEQAPLTDALRQIEEASGLNMAFAPELVRDAAPVTLRVVNEPAGEVLYRLLRERGLVPVYTADTMAAVVHEESFLGIAKIGGHAVRELVRLAEKLEAAEWRDGDVHVPGWGAEDDAAALAAVREISTFNLAAWIIRNAARIDADTYETAAGIHDTDVGIAAPYLPRLETRIERFVEGNWNSSKPLLRAACAFYAHLLSIEDPLWRDVLLPASVDESAVVRAAACASLARRPDMFKHWQADFRKDSSPYVRMSAWKAWLQENVERVEVSSEVTYHLRASGMGGPRKRWVSESHVPPEALYEMADALLDDQNPLVLPLALHFWQHDDVTQWELLSKYKDHPTFSLIEASANVRTLTQKGSEDSSEKRERAAVALAGSITAESRGGQLAAHLFLWDKMIEALDAPFEHPPEVTLFRQFYNSNSPWLRTFALLTAKHDQEELKRILNVLTSENAIEQWVGLIAMKLVEPGDHSPAIVSAAQKLLESPSLLERLSAPLIIHHHTDIKGLTEIALQRLKDAPDALSTRALLIRLRVYAAPQELRESTYKLWQYIAQQHNPSLQCLFVESFRHGLKENIPVIKDIFKTADFVALERLAAVTLRFDNSDDEAMAELQNVIIERFKMAFEADDLRHQQTMLRAVASVRFFGGRESAEAFVEELLSAVRWRNDDPEWLAAALVFINRNLSTIARLNQPLQPLRWAFTTPVQSAYQQEYAELLAEAYRQYDSFRRTLVDRGIRGCEQQLAEVLAVMDGARQTLWEQGTTEQKRRVAIGMAGSFYDPVNKEGVQLAQEFLLSSLPVRDEQLLMAYLRSQPELIRGDVLEHVKKRLADPSAPYDVRRSAILVLMSDEQWHSTLLNILENMSADPDDKYHFEQEVQSFRPTDEGLISRLVSLARTAMNDENRGDGRRHNAMAIYGRLARDEANEAFAAMIFDENVKPEIRRSAACCISFEDTETGFFQKALAQYTDLPALVRGQLVYPASRSLKAPGAEELVIRVLGDTAALHEDPVILFQIEDLTEPIMQAIRKLPEDELLRSWNVQDWVDGAEERWKRQQERERESLERERQKLERDRERLEQERKKQELESKKQK